MINYSTEMSCIKVLIVLLVISTLLQPVDHSIDWKLGCFFHFLKWVTWRTATILLLLGTIIQNIWPCFVMYLEGYLLLFNLYILPLHYIIQNNVLACSYAEDT